MDYLQNLLRLFQMQEDILIGRMYGEREENQAFEGISLESAEELFLNYCKDKSFLETEEKSYDFLFEALQKASVEIPSLSHLVVDDVVEAAILEARRTMIDMQDESNRSVREQERLREELALQRHFLEQYLQQARLLMQQKKDLLEEKMYSLREVILDLIHQRISLYENHLMDYLLTRMDNLRQDRGVLEEHLLQIQGEMATLPNKWVAEQLVHEEVNAQRKLVEEVTRIVESKNILYHLEMIQSKPIDRALIPLQSRYPGLLLWMALGGMLGFFGSMSFLLLGVARGDIPLSPEALASRSLPYVGEWKGHPPRESLRAPNNTDRDLLRKIAHWISEQYQTKDMSSQKILLVEGNGPHYGTELATLFSRMGKRVLLMELSFDRDGDASSGGGLLAYLEHRTPVPVTKKELYGASLESGGISSYVGEVLQSGDFEKILNRFSESYDIILGYSRSEPSSSELLGTSTLFPRCVVTYTNETFQEVSPFIGKSLFISCHFSATESARGAASLPYPPNRK